MKIEAAATWQAHIEIGRTTAVAKRSVRAFTKRGLGFLGQSLLQAAARDAAGEATVTSDGQLGAEWPRKWSIEANDRDERRRSSGRQLCFGEDKYVMIARKAGR